ncbi:hypothetical protein VI08_06450 [Luteibacter yeojuensis]|uniref:Peptidase S53 domain-containing protein n=2 Tax=Luteibacter yeojuensis TaxID=345309 RepID=A0A0F3KXY7_9GAMM|nr:hypothetical protein VI08_06450 [Luteibacter yeojuensis]
MAAGTRLAHLQLVLKPSAVRLARLQQLVADQHDPASPRFHQWLTPAEYGKAFGAADADISAVASWLRSQGVTVNAVYPNQSLMDITATAAQVGGAFHAQPMQYDVGGRRGTVLSGDMAIPSALRDVVAGVVGLNGRPAPVRAPLVPAKRDASTGRFMRDTSPTVGAGGARPMAIGTSDLLGLRGLVPDDLAQMYGAARLHKQGITGKGVTIALVELGTALPHDWSNFVETFDLAKYGGDFRQFNPRLGGLDNCYDTNTVNGELIEDDESAQDAEWATAMAPGAHIEVADCSAVKDDYSDASTNIYQGFFIAATNIVNGDERPDIMSFTVSYGEDLTDAASKAGMDLVMAQADAEGISVFAGAGDDSVNPSFYRVPINGAGISAGSLASSPNVTAVGGTDLADELDGTTAQYFRKKQNAVYGTAKGYVPEIPWNASCGNPVAARANGFKDVVAFCKMLLLLDPYAHYVTSVGGSGGPSVVNAKPAWQRLVHNAPLDQSRDVPDVALFGGSYAQATGLVMCLEAYPCNKGLTTSVYVDTDISLAAPMFAGIQALINQSLATRGLPMKQGNAAPTLYALAQEAYGAPGGRAPPTLADCNANDPAASCVFHNITRGSISTQCVEVDDLVDEHGVPIVTPDCAFYGSANYGGYPVRVGLTTTNAAVPYSPETAAYMAQPGWSFASGLGSVDAANLARAWRKFVGIR